MTKEQSKDIQHKIREVGIDSRLTVREDLSGEVEAVEIHCSNGQFPFLIPRLKIFFWEYEIESDKLAGIISIAHKQTTNQSA